MLHSGSKETKKNIKNLIDFHLDVSSNYNIHAIVYSLECISFKLNLLLIHRRKKNIY